jgi:hypothetical protein
MSNNTPDTPTPISSAGTPTQPYSNAAGEFNLKKDLSRKIKSRRDLNKQSRETPDLPDMTDPKYIEDPLNTGGTQTDNAIDRWYGSFSIEAKRNVFDLLKNHPEFDKRNGLQLNRVGNNTRNVLMNDPTKTVNTGGSISYQNVPQTSQKNYDENS